MSEVEWAVEKIDDEIVLTAADDEDSTVYTMGTYEAALLAAAIFDTIEQEESRSGEQPAND